MDTTISAVLLSILLYSLFVLLPMVPAIVIYRMFPDTKVALSGPFANLTMKSTGAFAAYVVVAVLGYFLVTNTHTIISGMVAPVWTIKATLQLRDAKDNIIDDPSPLKYLDVYLNPELRIKEGNFVTLQVPSKGNAKPNYFISFKIQDFGETTIDTAALESNQYHEDTFNRVLEIREPITIKKIQAHDTKYKETAYMTPSN